MTIARRALLGLIVLVAVLAVAGPVLALLAGLLGLLAAFCVALVLWSLVLLGERWVDEGLGGYGLLDALDDALNEMVLATVHAIASHNRRVKARLAYA